MSSSSVVTRLREEKATEEENSMREAREGDRRRVGGQSERWRGLSQEFRNLENPADRKIRKGSVSTGKIVMNPGSTRVSGMLLSLFGVGDSVGVGVGVSVVVGCCRCWLLSLLVVVVVGCCRFL